MSSQEGSLVISVCYVGTDDKSITVDRPTDSLADAQRLVARMFKDGYFYCEPSPAMLADGLLRIYIPISRVLTIAVRLERE